MNQSLSPRESADMIREKLEAIPSAMRQMGWMVSAELMEHWFRAPAWELPDAWKKEQPADMSPSHMNQRAMRMNWALSHGRVRIALNALRAKMANEAATKVLRRRLAALSWGVSDRRDIGSQRHSALELEVSCQSNFEPFGAKLDTMDDLYGSLGMATLKVGLIGEAMRESRTGRITFKVTHAGFYIRDTYDFNGFQYLGIWTKDRVLSKAQMLANSALDSLVFRLGGEPIGNVFNHDFAYYRRTTGFGGDFVIYSDVYWEPANMMLDLG